MIHLTSLLRSQPQLADLVEEVVSASGILALLGLPSPIPRSQHLLAHLTSSPYTNRLQLVFLFKKKTVQLIFCIDLLKIV